MKKKLLVVWRILVAAGMTCILLAGVALAYRYMKYQERCKRRYTYTSPYSDSYSIERYKQTIRLKSIKTGKYITPVFEDMYEGTVRDTLTVFMQKNLRGYLNVYTGKIVIPAQFDRAWIFSEGLGAVVKNGKVGFIDHHGELLIPYRFTFRKQWTERVDFLFMGGFCTVIDSTGKHGLIDKTGTWVVAPQYDYINNPVNGLRIVRNDGKYGVMDESLQFRLPVEYDWIILEQKGFLVRNGAEQQLLDLDGKTVLQPFVHNGTSVLRYNSGQVNGAGEDIYFTSDYLAFKIGDKTGLMNRNGKVVVPAIYENILAITNDLFSCRIASERFYITVNNKGEVIQ